MRHGCHKSTSSCTDVSSPPLCAPQEQRLQAALKSLRQDMHAEGLGQLRDVAAMFAQQFKASRIAHAEVQTAAAAEALQAAEAAAAEGRQPLPPRSAFTAQARVFAGDLPPRSAFTAQARVFAVTFFWIGVVASCLTFHEVCLQVSLFWMALIADGLTLDQSGCK